MKSKIIFYRSGFLLLWMVLMSSYYYPLVAQSGGYTFKDPPVVHINFGTELKPVNLSAMVLPEYDQVSGDCPIDGHYSYVSHTQNCFYGDWFTLNEDHTRNDVGGNMMLVNASRTGGVFYTTTLKGLKAQTYYEFAVWMMNLCRLGGRNPPLPPNIVIQLKTTDGRKLAGFKTGQLPQRELPRWERYYAYFTTPANTSELVLTMEDITLGGAGNDFAFDDITIREGELLKVESKPTRIPAKSNTARSQPKVVKPAINSPSVREEPQKNTTKVNHNAPKKDSINMTPVVQRSKPQLTSEPLPQPLATRANPLIKRITGEPGEIEINLYDNGQIDGDTVSIYHNNELVVSKAGLSQKPVKWRIALDAQHPHHEFVMVAENLGSIPPNTSLMIVKVGEKRYEVFISSSMQTNAKVVVDLNNQ